MGSVEVPHGSAQAGSVEVPHGSAPAATTQIIVLGSGSATGTPHARCITGGRLGDCPACTDAFVHGDDSRNKRGNPSILIQHNGKNILIDCGKTFRTSVQRAMKVAKIDRIDAVLLTHGHADAIFGLDDLREWVWDLGTSIPVYLRERDLHDVRRVFPYLVDRSKATGSGHVANLDFITFAEDAERVTIHGLDFTPLLLDHGHQSTALGYIFAGVAYLSDLNHVPDLARERLGLFDAAGPLDMALELVKDLLKPRRKAYLTGMSHEFDYATLNPLLVENYKEQGLGHAPLTLVLPQAGKLYELPAVDVEMAFDTQIILL